MKFRRTTSRGMPPLYIQESEDKMKERIEHDQGWPHLASNGNCICFCKKCMGMSGCICKQCAGIGHVNCPRASLTDEILHDKVEA